MMRKLCHAHYCEEVDKLAEAEWSMTKEWYIVTVESCDVCLANTNVPALRAEIKQLRASLEAVLDEATSDFNRDIIITECQSALEPECSR